MHQKDRRNLSEQTMVHRSGVNNLRERGNGNENGNAGNLNAGNVNGGISPLN